MFWSPDLKDCSCWKEDWCKLLISIYKICLVQVIAAKWASTSSIKYKVYIFLPTWTVNHSTIRSIKSLRGTIVASWVQTDCVRLSLWLRWIPNPHHSHHLSLCLSHLLQAWSSLSCSMLTRRRCGGRGCRDWFHLRLADRSDGRRLMPFSRAPLGLVLLLTLKTHTLIYNLLLTHEILNLMSKASLKISLC